MSENTEKKYHNLSEKLPSKIGFLIAVREYFSSILGFQASISPKILNAINSVHEKIEGIMASKK